MRAAAARRRQRIRLPRFGAGPQAIVVLLVLGLVGAMAIQPTRQLIEQRHRIEGMASDLQRIESLNERLETRIERLQDPDYIEQQAREKAGLIRPGERTFVVMPPTRKQQRRLDELAERRAAAKTPAPQAPGPGLIEGFLDFVGLG